jgi:hypothetical protein
LEKTHEDVLIVEVESFVGAAFLFSPSRLISNKWQVYDAFDVLATSHVS